MTNELSHLLSKIKQFRDERDWKHFHNHKDMAISIVLEASELLEHFQWKNPEEINKYAREKKDQLEEEIADIFIYLLELSDNLDINLIEAAEEKLRKNVLRYPTTKAKGTAKKYTEL